VTPSLTLPCHAKVNLALAVGGPRPGDGYHPICSWMARVSLHDDLTVVKLPEGSASEHRVAWAADAPQPSPIDWPIDKDLMTRAHRLLERRIGRALPLRAELCKRIPVGAGMAGGSTDGAAMLRAVDRLFELRLPAAELAGLASKLGSDVPFFLGDSSAIVSGVGERLEPTPIRGVIHLVLIAPALHCNTAAVYRMFDAVSPGAAVDEAGVRQLAGHQPLDSRMLFNDLAEPAMRVEPRLRQMRERLASSALRAVHVTGSGAAMFMLARDAADAAALAPRLAAECGAPCLPIHTI
jgi:4-diphosphocytidyl-2-C-methyl-D-erythritol kinase